MVKVVSLYMTVDDLLKLIPSNTFNDLAIETKVDFQVKKLTGETMFKLILFSMLNSDRLSLRVMETFLNSAKFKSFSEQELSSKFNSIRDRVCTINADYFENLFNIIFTTYNKTLKEEKSLLKADSTYVSIAANLFSIGMLNGTESYNKKHVKYSVNLKGSLPCNVRVYTEQSFVSEDLALTDLIDTTNTPKGSVVVFDRGLQSRKSFDNFSKKNKLFVGRGKPQNKIKVVSVLKINAKPKESTVTITSDEIGYLSARGGVKTKNQFRLIKAVIDRTGVEICFVTNILDLDAYLIASFYKQRWEIEVFFKFIKQNLNVKHLVSRNINGIKVMIYMTMILAILILAYKKLNKISGYKIAKLKFEIDLDNTIIKEIVLLCGGNPAKAAHLWNST
ncbi:MAG: IS4 family transposase [Alphaproteobacteria bacterium]|nr:IS4 family transposase [Alphaproteobacteria bacterium]